MEKLTQQRAVNILRILYPAWMVVGLFSIMYVPSTLIVQDDPGATAGNIMSNQFLFRAGIVGSLVTQLIYIFAVLLLYRVFEQVNRKHSLLMLIFALVSVPIAMLNELNNVAALLSLNNAEQMMFFLDLNAQGVVIASIFWGLWLFPLGYLIYISGYFPKIIGIAVLLGGVGYTLDSFNKLFFPDYELLGTVFEVLTLGEIVFLAWLLFMGARLPKAEA